MATDSSYFPTDAQLLYEFLGSKIDRGEANQPAVELLAELNAYSAQLEKLRRMVSQAEASLAKGEARELDVDALILRQTKPSSSS